MEAGWVVRKGSDGRGWVVREMETEQGWVTRRGAMENLFIFIKLLANLTTSHCRRNVKK